MDSLDPRDAEISKLKSQLEEARARVAKLEARLEIDHVWVSKGDGPLERVEIPPEKRDEQYDGIECRDETIRLVKDANAHLVAKAEEARAKAIRDCRTAVQGLAYLSDFPHPDETLTAADKALKALLHGSAK